MKLHLFSWTTEPLEVEVNEDICLLDALRPYFDKFETLRNYPFVDNKLRVRNSKGSLLEIHRKIEDFKFEDKERLFLEPGGMFGY
jgi:hypothetical protein